MSDFSMDVKSILYNELVGLEGSNRQDKETGQIGSDAYSAIGSYTNRIFGAPYQFLDSVDQRISNINSHLGNEYLRNILLNSPILTIRPGVPHYTGSDDPTSFINTMKSIFRYESDVSQELDSMGFAGNVIFNIAKSTIFSGGSKMQRRMYSFRETYYDYMCHVNYMCKSIANLMEFSGKGLPTHTFIGEGEMAEFTEIAWENYRMISTSSVKTPSEYLGSLILGGITDALDIMTLDFDPFQFLASTALSGLSSVAGFVGTATDAATDAATSAINSFASMVGISDELINASESDDPSFFNSASEYLDMMSNVMLTDRDGSMFTDAIKSKITHLQLMVDPVSFSEQLSNETKTSVIESKIDEIQDAVGSELAFIGNSDVDVGIIANMFAFTGNMIGTAASNILEITTPVTGGFAHNVFSGALGAVTGQKMIYPEIYKSSTSTMDYKFSMTLTSPYGDAYNYYMNIVVPLCHLICLCAPRMVTSNAMSTPYLVQAYMPGMCSCNLGIISSMTINKNPKKNHVSVNNFPLTVTVEFTVKELYNAMAISPLNDPASFLFNETLTDYMINMAGLTPSEDVSLMVNEFAADLSSDYVVDKVFDDIANWAVEGVENFRN